MSDSLDPRARAFLRSVQDGDNPTHADRDRVRGKVKAQLAAGVAAGVAALVSSKASAATAVSGVTAPAAATVVGAAVSTAPGAVAAAGSGIAVTKIASVLLVVAAVAGGTTAVVRRAQQTHVAAAADARTSGASVAAVSPAGVATGTLRARALQVPPPAAATPAPAATIEDGAGTVAVEAKMGGTEPARAPEAASALAASSPASPGIGGAPAAPAAPSTPASPGTLGTPAPPGTPASPPAVAAAPTLDDEVALVRDARAALRGGDAARSLSLLDTHDHLFPDGVLGEDCAAERVHALCALGRIGDARVVATRFLAEHPVSPHAPAVRASCGLAGATN